MFPPTSPVCYLGLTGLLLCCHCFLCSFIASSSSSSSPLLPHPIFNRTFFFLHTFLPVLDVWNHLILFISHALRSSLLLLRTRTCFFPSLPFLPQSTYFSASVLRLNLAPPSFSPQSLLSATVCHHPVIIAPVPSFHSISFSSVCDLSSLFGCPHHSCSPLLLSVCQAQSVLFPSLHRHQTLLFLWSLPTHSHLVWEPHNAASCLLSFNNVFIGCHKCWCLKISGPIFV